MNPVSGGSAPLSSRTKGSLGRGYFLRGHLKGVTWKGLLFKGSLERGHLEGVTF